MTHEKNRQPGTCTAPQYGSGFNKEQSIHVRGGDSPDETIQYFQEASLSVCPGSPADWKTSSGSGPKNGIYGQDFPEFDPFTSPIYQFHGEDPERNCYPGTGNFSAKRSVAWLKGVNAVEISSWNTVLTDCRQKRSVKCIGFWFPRKFGKWEIQTNRRDKKELGA